MLNDIEDNNDVCDDDQNKVLPEALLAELLPIFSPKPTIGHFPEKLKIYNDWNLNLVNSV